MTQGIDMSRSSWENPEGHQPRTRTERASAPEPACEAAGPDGWVCDLKPNHRGDVCKAEGGPEWPRMAVTYTWTAEDEPARVVALDALEGKSHLASILAEIHHMILGALDDHRPAAWATALNVIEEMTRDY
jgi:hypothetical protein